MGEITKIQWTDHTFNPWRGCSEVHPGCDNCYAREMAKRNTKLLGEWGPGGTRVVAAEAMWAQPLKWNRQAEKEGVRRRVFCASIADVFEDWQGPMRCHKTGGELVVNANGHVWPINWPSMSDGDDWGVRNYTMQDVRERLFRLIDYTPHLDWLLVTKRPENVRRMVHDCWTEKVHGHVSQNAGDGRRWKRRKNVWLLTSVSDQQTADAMIPRLLKCRDLVPVLGLSVEPLLGPIDLRQYLPCQCRFTDRPGWDTTDLLVRPNFPLCKRCNGYPYKKGVNDWVIVGGESGPQARPCDVEWVRSIVQQCQAAKVPVFVKQLGSEPQCMEGLDQDVSGPKMYLTDKKGGDPSEWPEDLRVREMPEVRA